MGFCADAGLLLQHPGIKQDREGSRNSSMKQKVSFVIPCYRSEKTIEGVTEEIKEAMGKLPEYTYEVILVNDCSPDDTFSVIRKLCEKEENIYGISLARNFGQHAALMAGFHQASGDILVCLDDDGQTPANEVGKLLGELEEPLNEFDEKLFCEIVEAISISHRDEMTVTLIGGLRFTEML